MGGDRAVLPAGITGAVQWDMLSGLNGRAYRICAFKPLDPPPKLGYPVVYVTDGNHFFGTAVLQAQGVRSALIVGIGFPEDDPSEYVRRRTQEFTIEGPGEDIEGWIAGGMSYGGGREFYQFIAEELEPELLGLYEIDRSKRALVGISLGGLFVLQVLLEHPDRFQTFVAGSPSIWWNDRAILHQAPQFRRVVEAGRVAPRVLITVGELEQSPEAERTQDNCPQEKIREFDDMIRRHKMVDNARELASELRAIRGSEGYRVDFHVFEGETHGSVIPATIGRAVSYALKT